MNTTSMIDDVGKGREVELIFKEDFLNFLGIEYVDVTGCQKFQAIDTDFKSTIGLYEIKNTYKDNRQVVIEEFTNINPDLCPISKGWFYKTKSDLVVFVSYKTRVMVLVPFTVEFKAHYESIKENYRLCRNSVTTKGANRWQSAIRFIPLDDIKGYYSMYKKL